MIPLLHVARFLSRWSAPTGSSGPLIVNSTVPYIALRLRLSRHKVAWVRWFKTTRHRVTFHGPLDLRGRKCECGSGRWIQNDVDGCMAPGCREYQFTGQRATHPRRALWQRR